jgi:hypothetical protein
MLATGKLKKLIMSKFRNREQIMEGKIEAEVTKLRTNPTSPSLRFAVECGGKLLVAILSSSPGLLTQMLSSDLSYWPVSVIEGKVTGVKLLDAPI